MSNFMLDCNGLKLGGNTFGNLSERVSQVSCSVNSYDVSNSDDFDFLSVKSLIVSNLDSCVAKMKNSQNLVNSVVEAHTQLQNSLKFGETASQSESEQDTNQEKVTGGHSLGDQAVTAVGVASSAAVLGVSSIPSTNISQTVSEKNDDTKTSDDNKVQDDNNEEFNTIVSNVEYVGVEDLTLKNIKKFTDKNIVYQEDSGFALIDDKYIVSCDSTYGEIGDSLTIVKSDNTEINCIIVNHIKNGEINFYIDSSNVDKGVEKNIIDINSEVKIINKGPIAFSDSSNPGKK